MDRLSGMLAMTFYWRLSWRSARVDHPFGLLMQWLPKEGAFMDWESWLYCDSVAVERTNPVRNFRSKHLFT